jgi:hypothetical protein
MKIVKTEYQYHVIEEIDGEHKIAYVCYKRARALEYIRSIKKIVKDK